MRVLFILPLFTIVSCGYEIKKKETTLDDPISKLEVERQVDSIMKAVDRDVNWDTVGVSSAPVLVVRSSFVKRDYSTYKDISVTYKNVSSKRIDAIRFRWYAENSFSEPADAGGIGAQGFGGGYTDDPIGAGKSRTSSWGILSRDGKKVVKAWPIEVVFADGSKWTSKSKGVN